MDADMFWENSEREVMLPDAELSDAVTPSTADVAWFIVVIAVAPILSTRGDNMKYMAIAAMIPTMPQMMPATPIAFFRFFRISAISIASPQDTRKPIESICGNFTLSCL